MAQRLQLTPKLDEIVDLAVEENVVAAVRRAHGLPAGIGQVENGQPTMEEHDLRPGPLIRKIPARFDSAAAIPEEADIVGPSVGQAAREPRHQLPIDVPRLAEHDPGDTAHTPIP